MKIAIVCGYPIPHGMAASTRIFAYSKGLTLKGADVQVYSFIPSGFGNERVKENSGVYDGVYFCYPYRRKRKRNKMLHLFEILYSLILLFFRLRREHRKKKYDSILISSDYIPYLLYGLFLNLFLTTKLIFIFDEYPKPIRCYLKDAIPSYKKNLYSCILRYYSGYVSMTRNLLNFYQEICRRPGVVVSSITDVSRFENIQLNSSETKKKIVYMGNMELSKDNVDNIIKAFALVKDSLDCDLYLYGHPSSKDKQKLLKIIDDYQLTERVVFGSLNFEEVPQVLCNAYVLVSSQPDTIRAAGGFPTKLGEYMMTGKPVLLTNVGEISMYVSDGENVYLSKPDSPKDYAEKLCYIFEHYNDAFLVGCNGRNLILNKYSHIQAGSDMYFFINSI